MGTDFYNARALARSRDAGRPFNLERILERMVQIGRVMDVDEKKHAARVKFESTGIHSGWLKILDNRPYFPDYDEELAGHFGREPECERVRWEENEDTGAEDVLITETEDIIYPFNEEDTEPEPEPEPEPEEEEEEEEDGGGGNEEESDAEEGGQEEEDEYGGIRSHSNKVKTRMWLPHIDDTVLCLYLPIRNGDGFILGKIWQ